MGHVLHPVPSRVLFLLVAQSPRPRILLSSLSLPFPSTLKSITWRLFILAMSLVPVLYWAVSAAQQTTPEILVARGVVL